MMRRAVEQLGLKERILDRIIYFWDTGYFYFYGFGSSGLWRMVFVRFSDPILRGVSNDGAWKDGWTLRIGILCYWVSHYKIYVGTDRLGQTDGKKDGHCQSEWREGMVWGIWLVIRRRWQIFWRIFRGRWKFWWWWEQWFLVD